jgi:hypothetical protein
MREYMPCMGYIRNANGISVENPELQRYLRRGTFKSGWFRVTLKIENAKLLRNDGKHTPFYRASYTGTPL